MIRLLHLSDPHFGAADEGIARAFLKRAAELSPDLTVLSGDLTMRSRRRELKEARQFVDALPFPRLVIPGNHDIPGFNQPFDRIFRPFRRFQETLGPALEPGWSGSGIQAVGLNSNRAIGLHPDWSEGRLSRKQLDRAGRRFSPDARLRVLVLHHPLLAPEGYRRAVVKPLCGLHAMLSTHRVDLVLCGHFHRSCLAVTGADESWRAVVSQAPTVCSNRLQGEPQGFHEISWAPGKLHVTLHRFGPDGFSPAAAFAFTREGRGWHREPA